MVFLRFGSGGSGDSAVLMGTEVLTLGTPSVEIPRTVKAGAGDNFLPAERKTVAIDREVVGMGNENDDKLCCPINWEE